MRLSKGDLDRLSQTIRSLYAEFTVSGVNTAALSKIPALIPCDVAAVTLVPQNGEAIVHHNTPSLENALRDRIWALREFLHQHPLENAGAASAQWGATCLSDFLSKQNFHRTDLYNEFYRHLDVEYQLGIYTQRIGGFRIGVTCNGKAKDFTPRDRAVLTHLSPHILQAYQNAFAISKLQRAATSFEVAAEAHGHGFIRVNKAGAVTDSTALAGHFLHKYFDHPPHTQKSLPSQLQAWLRTGSPEEVIGNRLQPLIVLKGAAKLVVRAAQEGAHYILLLAEQKLPPTSHDLSPLGLRPREREILFWMCHGKSNPEIATILSVSVRTIHKHNENIFRKLGVENRHAAMLVAAPLLRDL